MHSPMAFFAIFGTAVCALLGLPWLGLVVGAAVLALLSMTEHRDYRSRFAAVGMADVYRAFAWSNVGTSIVAAGAASGMGMVVRLVAFA